MLACSSMISPLTNAIVRARTAKTLREKLTELFKKAAWAPSASGSKARRKVSLSDQQPNEGPHFASCRE